jgi:hypothetical protein
VPQSAGMKLFISYSHEDSGSVHPLVRLLQAAGVDVFIDVESVEYGKPWEFELEEAIRNAGRIFVFWSKNAAQSQYVKREYSLAIQIGSVRIIPIPLDNTPLPRELAQFQAYTKLNQDLGQLLVKLEQIEAQLMAPKQRHPYRAVLAAVIAVIVLSIIAMFSQTVALRILATFSAFVSAYTIFRILGMYKVYGPEEQREEIEQRIREIFRLS